MPRFLRSPHATVALLALAACPLIAPADQRPIQIDGVFDDWAGAAPAWTDPEGDAPVGFLDIGRIWISDDDDALFVRFEVDTVFDLAEEQDLRLYLDTDANSGTGLAIHGIGAELEWRFGSRQGTFRPIGGGSNIVYHDDLGFVGLPTVTAAQFEVVFDRDALPNGSDPLFDGSLVRVVLAQPGGDRAPNTGSTLTYAMDVGSALPAEVLPLGRLAPTDLRLTSLNVLSDGPWDPALADGFERLISAAAPDILCFQEIYSHSSSETRNLVQSWLGGSWFYAGNADCKLVSRYPVIGSWGIDGNLAVRLDTTAAIGTELLVINAHLPCCANDSGRREEIDAILAFIRESREPGGALTLPIDTPVVITGDLNLVGQSQQLASLVTGNIIDNGTYGPDFVPDHDGTTLTDRIARQTERRLTYTWRSDTSSFWPGRLDFVIYTDSVLAPRSGYVVYTPGMSPGVPLLAAGLLAGDSLVTDHLLVVADFAPPDDGPIPGDVNGDGVVNVSDLVQVILAWGPCGVLCPADVNGDGAVDVSDLVMVVLNWTA